MYQTTRIFIFFILSLISSLTFANPVNPTLLHGKNDPYAGNPKGNVTLIEFFDYQCAHCTNMAPIIQRLVQANPNLKVIFKEFPIRGPVSEYAARAALAANKQGKYRELYHALMSTRYTLTESQVLEIAKNTGLNIKQLKKDMDSQSIINQIETNLSLARELNLNGTPAFILSKSNATQMDQLNVLLGEMSQSELQNLIQSINR
jgi:protein-disulfide isomerase